MNPLKARNGERGFTILELLIVMAIILIITAFAAPAVSGILRNLRIGGDARSLAEATAMAKMRAAAEFTRSRVYVDTSGGWYKVQIFDKVNNVWVDDSRSGQNYLSQGVTFGFNGLTSPPSNTQAAIGQAALCQNATTLTNTDANTACAYFNSRGTSVDKNQSPIANAFYMTNGNMVYGTEILANGFIQNYRTDGTNSSGWYKL